MSLATKYRPKTFDDVVEQPLIVEMLSNMCKSELSNRNFLFTGPAGCGKAQPLDSRVLTPHGFVKMGDIRVGDSVINAEGKSCTVLGVYPQGVRPIYEITTQGNNKIRVSDEHLNNVWVYNQDKKVREDYTLTTLELKEFINTSRFKVRVDIPTVDWEYSPVPIDPYLLGILIADGSLSGNFSLANPELDIIEKVQNLLRTYGCELRHGPLNWTIVRTSEYKKEFGGHTYKFKDVLRDLGLLVKSIDKHIPDMYLYNSKDIRLALLQGMFDGDGNIGTNGTVEYSTSSKRLSEDFAFLVRSLGIRDTIVSAESAYTDSDGVRHSCSTTYRHCLKIPNGLKFYTSEKHTKRYRERQHPPLRNIISIDYIGDAECQCIYVDTPSHTYISDDFIPTHNTTFSRIVGTTLNDGLGEIIEIDAASYSGADKMREIVQQARTYPIGSKYKIIIIDECHSLSSQAWQVLLKTLEESPAMTVFLLCTTNPEKIPDTIISRVQCFQLSKISLSGITNRLIHVLDCEISEGQTITYEPSAIVYIAKLANGGMRDALTLLDKALAFSNNITTENLVNALNLPNYDIYFTLLAAVAKHDNSIITQTIHDVYNSGVNFIKWFESFHSFVINIVKYIFLQDIDKTMIPTHYADKISKYGSAHSAVCLKLANKLVQLNQELKSTNYQQELALTYLCSAKK